MSRIVVSGVADFAALGARWRDLESRANLSFFQSWTWMGCLVEERFADPVLVEAFDGGRTVALALFNRRRRWGFETLHLGESGDPILDRPYIEYNAVLTEAGREAELTHACLRRLLTAIGLPRTLILNGIDDLTLRAARKAAGAVRVVRTQPAPYADLAMARSMGGDVLARRSANTRQQVRRSDRDFAESGPLTLLRAATGPEAHAFLDAMAPLHQATWLARGEPGCFAEPFFGRFHHALIERGAVRGEIDLLRIHAGAGTVGILYNFRFRGRSLAYQSGFDYAAAGPRRKPGMSCHRLAMQFSLREGLDCYDFLAGDARYKRVLSDGAADLHWIEAAPALSPLGLHLGWRLGGRAGAVIRRRFWTRPAVSGVD